ncbi:MAG: pyridoxamine 5'-phosphate oxidase family protein [Candidatus Saccharibacteria bacterium]
MKSKLADNLSHKTDGVFSDRKRRMYAFLRNNPTAVLSSVDAIGDPHGTVIYFAIDKDFTISFLTKKQTKKYDNLQYNNRIMLTVFEPHTQTIAQVVGMATEIKSSYEVIAIASTVLAASLKTNPSGTPPLAKLEAGPYVAFKVDLVQVRMAIYSRPDSGDYRELFESIESFELTDKG